MNDFGDQGKSLECTRSEIFHQQKVGEAVQFTFIGSRENRAKSLQIDIFTPYVMMPRHVEMPKGERNIRHGLLGRFVRNGQQSVLRGLRLAVNQIQNFALMLSGDSGVRSIDEIPHVGRVSVIAPRQP